MHDHWEVKRTDWSLVDFLQFRRCIIAQHDPPRVQSRWPSPAGGINCVEACVRREPLMWAMRVVSGGYGELMGTSIKCEHVEEDRAEAA